MGVCVYERMYVCVCVCLYVRIYVCVCVCVYVRMYVYVCVGLRKDVGKDMCMHVCN